MDIKLITLYSEELEKFFLKGLFKKAFDRGLFSFECIQLRDFSVGKHQKVDDYPFGVRKGMLLRADVIRDAVCSIPDYESYDILYTCPKGETFDQSMAQSLSSKRGLILICGYYKGIDARLESLIPAKPVSIGNFVLSSGEMPALMMAEAVLRLIPGVVGNHACVEEDSVLSGLLYPPDYTAPRDIDGIEVPEVLISGNHQRILSWRNVSALNATLMNRLDLLQTFEPTDKERQAITAFFVEE